MSDKPKFFNPKESTKPTPPVEAKKESILKLLFKKKKQPKESTRSIRFVKRGVQNAITYFFWLLLFISIFFVGISYARQGYILRKINEKAVEPQEIVQQINDTKELEELAHFESLIFIKNMFTVNQENREERKEFLEGKLATNLTENMLYKPMMDTKQKVLNIETVDKKLISSEKKEYEFIFDVIIENEKNTFITQLKLVSSMKNNDFKVINYPTYLNVERADNLPKNDYIYQEKEVYSKGEVVEAEERKAIEQFTNDFFKLYVKNDDSLKLISTVKGLNNAELVSCSVTNVVKQKDFIKVEGTYSFNYEGSSEITSFFSLKVSKNKDNYFVNEIN